MAGMGSGASPTATLHRDGGRAFGPGSRRTLAAVAALLAVAAAIAVAVVLVTRGGGSHGSSVASLKYGQIPSWLPKPTPPPNQIASASAAHPVLAAIEGNTVQAQLPGGSAMVTAVGPAIPDWVSSEAQSGQWNGTNTAPTTFDVTFASAKGAVPLRASAFSILTNEGQIVHPAVTAQGGGPLPAQITPGKPVTLLVKVALTEGDGALRWAPSGPRVLVAWLYQLELD
jgi:hypothetical protein